MFEGLGQLSDRELLSRVESLVRDERRTSVQLVAHLAEMESRQLYLELGYASLFTYCTQELHLSEHAAYNRIEAARAARRVPAVLAWLERGDVHLTAVKLLASVLTPENQEDILAAAKHKSRREIEELIARLRPQPDVPDQVRAVKAGSVASKRAQETKELTLVIAPVNAGVEPHSRLVPGRVATSPPAAAIVPLAPERYRIQFTASAATRDKLRRAQELLRHRIPDGDLARVFDLALDCLVRDLEKKKTASTDRPRGALGGDASAEATKARPRSGLRREPSRVSRQASASRQTSRMASRHIPAAVRRDVWRRDGGRCTFVGANGVRCIERGWIEFDHRWPHGDGGKATLDNVRLLCRSHNQHEARRFFGVWEGQATSGEAHDGGSLDGNALEIGALDQRPNSFRDELRAYGILRSGPKASRPSVQGNQGAAGEMR